MTDPALPEPMPQLPAGLRALAGSTIHLGRSPVVLSAYGLNSFVGQLSLDGTLEDSNLSASPLPELSGTDPLGYPFWDASWWSWSPLVQQRVREAVQRAAAGRVFCYSDTALVRRNQLISVDLAWVPLVRFGVAAALICSVIDVTGRRYRARPLPHATLTRRTPTCPAPGRVALSWVEGIPA
jgi:hypothetical protein